jgi:uncharacterized membrane protein YjjB (DUF3815 family)
VVAFAAQRTAAGVFGGHISGFFGMLVATPLNYLIQQQLKGPPAMVTFLPSFWLAVPGALGLLSITRMLTDRDAGIDGLITVTYVLVSIALGTLVGASAYRALTDHVGWWRTRIRDAGARYRGQPPAARSGRGQPPVRPSAGRP